MAHQEGVDTIFFDATLMWAVLVIFNVWHPSHVEALYKGGKCCERGVKIVEIKKEELNGECWNLGITVQDR